MKEYGYIRVSGANQNESRQMCAMSDLSISRDRIFMDKLSGKDFNRPAYKALIKKLQEGDILYISSIDRLGRNYSEIQAQCLHTVKATRNRPASKALCKVL